MLTGKRLPDAIANGTYHIDIHNAKGAGVAFRPQGEVPMVRHGQYAQIRNEPLPLILGPGIGGG